MRWGERAGSCGLSATVLTRCRLECRSFSKHLIQESNWGPLITQAGTPLRQDPSAGGDPPPQTGPPSSEDLPQQVGCSFCQMGPFAVELVWYGPQDAHSPSCTPRPCPHSGGAWRLPGEQDVCTRYPKAPPIDRGHPGHFLWASSRRAAYGCPWPADSLHLSYTCFSAKSPTHTSLELT